MPRTTFEDELRACGIDHPPEQKRRLRIYRERLERWNRAMNLTALEGAELTRRLIVEPLVIFDHLRPSGSYLDIGSGNGSPAIPWLTSGSFQRAELIEARKKRAVFLHQTCQAIGMTTCVVHACRFSEFPGLGDSVSSGAGALRAPDWITIQGVRADLELWNQINKIRGPETRVVWFTGAKSVAPDTASRVLSLPGSARRAMIFGKIPS